MNQSMNDDDEHASGTAGPHGELLLRTLAMLADTNPGGDIFGGWLMSQMDMAARVRHFQAVFGPISAVDPFRVNRLRGRVRVQL